MKPLMPTPHCYRLVFHTEYAPIRIDLWAWSAADAEKQGPSVLSRLMRHRKDYYGWHSVDIKPWIHLREMGNK
jgi:hypothetical protein